MENTILFVGATGVGKSFICNKVFKMCSSPTRFESGSALTATTGALQQGHINYDGKRYSIVDSPGFYDTQIDSTPETTAKTDGENMCKLVKALEDCNDIYCVVFLFEGKFSVPHKMWYERILEVVGKGYQGQIILMNNKQALMSEEDLLRNEFQMQLLLGVNEGTVQYFPIPSEPGDGLGAESVQVKEQLTRFLSTVTKFVPFNLKDLKIPDICYEKEITEDPFERELARSSQYIGVQKTNILDKSGCVDQMVGDGNPILRFLGCKTGAIKVFEEDKQGETIHVPHKIIRRVVGDFRRTYKIRFDGTRDLVKEECVQERKETFQKVYYS